MPEPNAEPKPNEDKGDEIKVEDSPQFKGLLADKVKTRAEI